MQRLRQLREENGYTQAELGDKIGYSQRSISNWEKGIAQPNIENLKTLAAFFNVSVDYLIGNTDEWGNVTISSGNVSGNNNVVNSNNQIHSGNNAAITNDERELLRLWKKTPPDKREAILKLLK